MNTYESYVPYEAAKQMKALGFSELCHTTYDTTTLDRDWQVHTGQHVLLSNKISCPTQEQAIDWFIEKHGLLILVDYDYYMDDKKFHYGCSVVETGELDPNEDFSVLRHNDNTLFDNRRDAIDRGIDMCIGLVLHRMSKKSSILP